MNILHISDFHYCEENLISERLVQSVIKAVKDEGLIIDCILFTGDLVYYGNLSNDFHKAKTVLFDALADSLCVDSNNIIICPGNHDINRDKVYPTADNSFKTVYNNNQAINKLYSEKNEAFQDSLLPSANYLSFEKSFYSSSYNDIIKELYSIHFRTIQGLDYAFVCLNSAWISALDKKGSNDRGNLLFPPDALKEAITIISVH